MSQERFAQPVSCERNESYYLKVIGNGNEQNYIKVHFVSYRPHPAEVLIHDGFRIRMVHRALLYVKENGAIDQE
jgi:hypothetical protein